MKTLRSLITIAFVLCCGTMAFADSTPPDGGLGVKGGTHSTPITSTVANFTLTPCQGATDQTIIAECTEAGPGTQAVFGGLNESNVAWNSLTIKLNLNQNPSNPDLFINCNGGTLFTIVGGGCGQAISPTDTSVTLLFLQGTGSGIGCTDGGLGANPSYATDLTCLNASNNILAKGTNSITNPYDYYNSDGWTCPPGIAAGAVCGSNDFLISVGGPGQLWNSIPPGGTLMANPEPATFLLVGGAMLVMLFLGLKKTRLVQA